MLKKKKTPNTANVFVIIVIILCHCCLPQSGFSQTSPDKAEIYTWLDNKTGIENTGLYKGIVYVEEYRTINEKTQFLGSPDFLEGTILYNHQWYFNIPVKYDAYHDRLIVKVPNEFGGISIVLVKENVEEFIFEGRYFRQLFTLKGSNGSNGFYEQLWESDHYALLARHSKKRIQRKNQDRIYFEFTENKKTYAIKYKESTFSIDNEKDLLNAFPEHQEEIQNFYKDNKRLKSRDREAFMLALIKYLETINP